MYRAERQRKERVARRTPAEGFAAPRTVTCYRVAKLTLAGGPILCLVRALSERSAALEIDLPFAAQEQAMLEIGRERLTGALARVGERRAELICDEPLDVDAILADPSLVAAAGQRTLPRVEVDARCRIDAGAHRIAAKVLDISTDGVKVYCEDLLCVGDEIRLVLQGLDSAIPGIVRWCSDDHTGVEFHQRLPLGRLNAWLAAQAAPVTEDEPCWAPPVISKS
jgi:hypothetical protein